MKKILINNLIIALSYLCVWLIIDIIDVKYVKISGHDYELVLILGVVLFSFILANKSLFKRMNPIFRSLSVLILSAVFTTIWFFISITILLEFHITIGGNL
jgi:hypothetical protein